MRFTPNYYLACRIQDKILNMMGVKPQNKNHHDPEAQVKLSAGELSSLTKAFDTMEERKRILRMKGLPKPIDSDRKEKHPARVTFTE